jgi:hypothetical protein
VKGQSELFVLVKKLSVFGLKSSAVEFPRAIVVFLSDSQTLIASVAVLAFSSYIEMLSWPKHMLNLIFSFHRSVVTSLLKLVVALTEM